MKQGIATVDYVDLQGNTYQHKADPASTRRIRRAHAALACHVAPSRAASWAGLEANTVQQMSCAGRWDAIGRGEKPSLIVRRQALGVLNNKHSKPRP